MGMGHGRDVQKEMRAEEGRMILLNEYTNYEITLTVVASIG